MTTAEFFNQVGPGFCAPDYEVFFKQSGIPRVRFVWIGIGTVECILTESGRPIAAMPGGVK